MNTVNDVWHELGELAPEECMQVLTRLFALYEEQLRRKSDDGSALEFFRNLAAVLAETRDCNLNRR